MASGEYVQLRVTDPGGGERIYNLKLDGDSLRTPDGWLIEPMSAVRAAEAVRSELRSGRG